MMKRLETLKKEVRDTLLNNILPYWMNNMVDITNGGFYGRISAHEEVFADAEKGAVLNTRILWTFSAAYRLLKDPAYLEIADRAKQYIIQHFFDHEYGGVYWSLDYKGQPKDTKKQIYALGFAIYGLSEYHRSTGDEESLKYAIDIFHSIEKHSFDSVNNGYCEALTRHWEDIEDMRLSEKDVNERKTMNTHLHILEAYTNLYRVWKDETLKKQLRNLILIFLDKIIDEQTHHLGLFFDDEWHKKGDIDSYGHDIETSWLLHEAALVLDDEVVLNRVEEESLLIADAAREGVRNDGGMIYEKDNLKKVIDDEYHWWVQAEAVVGYVNIYQYLGDEEALSVALNSWSFIKENLIDKKHGEWYWSVMNDGSVNCSEQADKAGFWKCPYHNGRMCLEIIERL